MKKHKIHNPMIKNESNIPLHLVGFNIVLKRGESATFEVRDGLWKRVNKKKK